MLDLVFLGEPGSKANRRKIVKFGNRSALIKSDKARKYSTYFLEQAAVMDVLASHTPYERDVMLRIDFYYASRRPDLAGMDLVMDLLENAGVYLNDRQVKISASTWSLDPDNPRIRVRCAPLDSKGNKNYNDVQLGILWG